MLFLLQKSRFFNITRNGIFSPNFFWYNKRLRVPTATAIGRTKDKLTDWGSTLRLRKSWGKTQACQKSVQYSFFVRFRGKETWGLLENPSSTVWRVHSFRWCFTRSNSIANWVFTWQRIRNFSYSQLAGTANGCCDLLWILLSRSSAPVCPRGSRSAGNSN